MEIWIFSLEERCPELLENAENSENTKPVHITFLFSNEMRRYQEKSEYTEIGKIQNLFILLFLFSNEKKGCQEKLEYAEN